MIVRAASPADVPEILPLVRELCDLHARRDPERFQVRADILDRYAQWLPARAEDPRSVLLVATEDADARIVGFTVGTVEPEVPIFWIPECGWIHDLYVLPSHRSRGHATALVRSAVDRFKAMGVAQIRLHTGAFNDDARAFFARLGFRTSVIEMLHTLKPPQPEIPGTR
jgi:GNAT superfamily N-acetyltransferase